MGSWIYVHVRWRAWTCSFHSSLFRGFLKCEGGKKPLEMKHLLPLPVGNWMGDPELASNRAEEGIEWAKQDVNYAAQAQVAIWQLRWVHNRKKSVWFLFSLDSSCSYWEVFRGSWTQTFVTPFLHPPELWPF